MGGGGKSSTSTQTVSIPPEVLARYNAVNARAESVAQQPFQQYGGEFVAPLTPTQTAGIEATSKASQLAQPYYGAATGAAIAGAMPVNPQGLQVGQYMNPFTQSVVGATQAAMGQQQGQQLAQQQAESIRAGAFGGDRAGLQRQALRGQQGLAQAQAIAPLYQQGYQQALQTAQQQQGVGLGAQQANRQAVQQLSQQLGGLGTGAQQAALQGAQAQIGAGTLQQQTQQAQDTAQYQQFLQQRGYDFQVAQFLANIAMGTGALSGSTTTSTQPRGFFSNRGGFKTGESLHRSGKAYGGGLDPNSMGGAVYEPGAFERGGYALSGSVVDPTDLNAILAQQLSFQSPRGGVGPYGQAPGATPHGPGGIVPQQRLTTPKLVTAGPLPKQQAGVGSDLGKVYGLANEATAGLTGKSLTERAGEKMGLRDSPEKIAEAKGANMPGASANATTGSQNPSGGVMPMPTPRDSTATSGGEGLLDRLTGLFKSEGGGIMPRHHYADGGGDDSQADEAIPYDPSDVQGGKDPMEGVLKAGTQRPQLKTAGGGGGGSGGGGLGSDLMKGAGLISAGKTLYSAGSGLASFLPTLFLADGGVVPRQHFDEGGDAEQPVRKYFDYLTKEKGYEPHVAAGILGNAYHESGGLQPGIVGDQGKSIGLFQFHEKGEQPAFRQWASENQRSISDPYAQIDFVHNQLQGPYAKTLEQMRSAADPSSAAESFMRGYERPKEGPTAALDRRQAYANAIASGEKLPTFRAYAGNQGGLGGAGQEAIQRATSGEGKALGAGQEQPGFFDRNKGIILPVLQGIGAMASSKSISPFAAALQGLGAGAKAYGEEEARQAGIEQTKAQTFESAQRGSNLSFLRDGTLVRMPDGSLMLTVEAMKKGLIPLGGKIAGLAENSAASKYLQSIGINAPAATQYLKEPEPKVPDLGPKPIDQSIDPNMTDRGIFGNSSRQLAQKDAYRTMGLTPAGAAQVSKDYETSTAAAALSANNNTPIVNSLIGNTSKIVNAQGLDVAGKTNQFRANLANGINTLAKAMKYEGEPILAADTNAAIQNKLNTFLASQSTEAAGQHNLGALKTMLGAMADPEMPPQAQAKIAAQIMSMTQKAKDRDAHREVFGDVSGGSFATAGKAFEDDTRGRYEREERLLGALILKDPQAVEKLTTGTKSPQVIEQYFRNLSKATGVPYTPGLSRYFVSGVQ